MSTANVAAVFPTAGWPAHALIALVVIAGADQAAAQDDTGSELSEALANLDIGDVVRVRTAGPTLLGSVASVGSRCLFLDAPESPAWASPPCAAPDSGSFSIPFVAIEALHLRGNHAARGIAIGALIGGLGLGLYAVGIVKGLDGPSDSGETVEAAVLLGGLGALSGALVGGLVGHSVPHWKTVYP